MQITDMVAPLPNRFQHFRIKRGITLAGVNEISGIGTDTLSNIENGAHAATIETVWKLAKMLGLSFGDLADQATAESTSNDSGLHVHLINKQSSPRVIESFLMTMAPNASRIAEPHGPGVVEHVVVLKGAMLSGPAATPTLVWAGQPYSFDANVSHIYRSLEQSTIAMVTVVWPELATSNNHFDSCKPWPANEDQWQGVSKNLARCQLEVAQGLGAFRMQFDDCQLGPDIAAAELATRIGGDSFASAINNFIVYDGVPAIVGFQRTNNFSTLSSAVDDSDILRRAVDLVNLGAAPAQTLPPKNIAALHLQVKGPTLVLAALAAELLTRHGMPCVPRGMTHKKIAGKATAASPSYAAFEDRIDVDAYATYELLHPAYAKQSVAIARVVSDLRRSGNIRLLEIGTGPGTPLQMLLEMTPELEVVAVEPSEVAFCHLSRLFEYDQRVVTEQASITSLPDKYGAFDVAVSVGASHHLNTSHFLQSAHANLKPGSLFIVADEMISPFKTTQQRQSNLVAHHLQYIADTLVPLDKALLIEAECVLVRTMQNEIPLALYEAHADLPEAAMQRCRLLLEKVRSLDLPEPASHPLMAFYRFHLLEMEALVAGLDYEVEQKTYPKRFRDLAHHAGFTLREHQRLYATHGDSAWDAGTHLFVLQAGT